MDYEEYKRKALEPIVNYIESAMASYSKEELEARIKKALPEKESEDERIRKAIGAAICGTTAISILEANGTNLPDALSYLGKQKEPHYTKRNALFDKCVENCDPDVMKRVSDEVDEMLSEKQKEQKPAKKDEIGYDLGREKGMDAGIEYVLNHLELYGLCKLAEWSEEDKVMLNNIIWSIHMKSIKPLDEMDDRSKYEKYEDFLKSLPIRFNLQPKVEWSEEDERIYQSIMDDTVQENQLDEKQINWLRDIKYRNFVRPKNIWKPSEEQMTALKLAYEDAFECPESGVPHLPLESLLSDLQKRL